MWSVLHADEWQETSKLVVISLETDVDSELPLTSFNVTHPGLAVVSKLIHFDNHGHTLTSDWETA